ncbi:deoxyhypusine synthase [Gamsiella multidivaricata]|uniref:deoxyhypusine synthase n=1 Tax=Gamsiella multidivaricata TaxID=101098 RepID=UPI00221E74D1|nr:deoxyhypusine synthase [Gamsiella multidivaricata]KAI7819582.1 deoxyhypusine synthase [Gamsiella multidivaricata]
MPKDSIVIKGPDFNQTVTLDSLLSTFIHSGFQASAIGRAIEIINEMRQWRLSDEPLPLPTAEDPIVDPELLDPEYRKSVKCKIFLGYTSNLVSSGVREVIRFLVQHKLVDCLVSSAGGVEEDFIKCLAPTYLGEFSLDGSKLRKSGLNRIGNLLVPNDNYCKFEDWVMPILDKMLEEQKDETIKAHWAPSSVISRLGKEIAHEESIYYWAYKNDIPVFCPALTDGSLGDMIYFHSYKNPGLIIDIVSDIRAMNNQAVFAKKTGVIILGGGVVKHHICNANLMRNGADFAVFINTGQEFDGSDAGARPDEAVSWGKIRMDGKSVKVYTDATIAFPLIVSQTFAKEFQKIDEKFS